MLVFKSTNSDCLAPDMVSLEIKEVILGSMDHLAGGMADDYQ
jgi:hypothetical protein